MKNECEACGQMELIPQGRSDDERSPFGTCLGGLCDACWRARQRIRRELAAQRLRMRQERAN